MIFNEKTKKWESPYWHPAVTTDAVVFGFDKEAIGHYLVVSSNRMNQPTNVSTENCSKNHI